MARGGPKVCVKSVWLLARTAAERGIDAQPLLKEQGLEPSVLANPDTRVPYTVINALWQKVPLLADDHAFGLHAAESMHRQILDAFDAAIFHADSVGGALQNLSRYARLMHEGATVELLQEQDVTWCVQRFAGEPPPRHLCELIIGMWVLRIGKMLGSAPPLRAVELFHPPPADIREHRRILGDNLRFDVGRNAICLDSACLKLPILDSVRAIGTVMTRHLDTQIATLQPADDFLTTARQAVREELESSMSSASLNIKQVARRLHTSERTLQRRLQEQSLSFYLLLDEARRERVLSLMRNPRHTLAEVAFLGGYSEMSSFFRAFRRWTGKTPSAYRGAQT